MRGRPTNKSKYAIWIKDLQEKEKWHIPKKKGRGKGSLLIPGKQAPCLNCKSGVPNQLCAVTNRCTAYTYWIVQRIEKLTTPKNASECEKCAGKRGHGCKENSKQQKHKHTVKIATGEQRS